MSKITQSHVVRSRKTAKKYAKRRDGRTRFFFFLPLSFLSSSWLLKFPSLWLLDILSSTFNEHPATDGGFSLIQEFLLDFLKKSPTCAFKK